MNKKMLIIGVFGIIFMLIIGFIVLAYYMVDRQEGNSGIFGERVECDVKICEDFITAFGAHIESVSCNTKTGLFSINDMLGLTYQEGTVRLADSTHILESKNFKTGTFTSDCKTVTLNGRTKEDVVSIRLYNEDDNIQDEKVINLEGK